jgi:RimJ/RimL family protein N-acetyltransferase
MPSPQMQADGLVMRAVNYGDIDRIRQWRNDQMDVLRQDALITEEAQQRYFEEHIWPDKLSHHPRNILLALERAAHLVGYGGLVHISWQDQRAELSFLLDPCIERSIATRTEIFSKFLRLIQVLAFAQLKLSRLWTETYAHRVDHLRTLEDSGFKFEGCLRRHVTVDGKLTDSVLHGLLLHEWEEAL